MSLRFIRGVAERALRAAARLLAEPADVGRATSAHVVDVEPVPAILDPSVPTADLPVRLQLLRAVADGRAFRPSDVGAIIGREMTVESSLVYVRLLADAGYVQRDGDVYRITPAGRAVKPTVRRSETYSRSVSGLSLAALEYLATHGPASAAEVMAHTERSRDMAARMRRLRKRGLIVVKGGLDRITDEGRSALERGRAEEARHGRTPVRPAYAPMPTPRPEREPTPIRVAGPRAESVPSRPPAGMLSALSHGHSMRLREIMEHMGMSEADARAEVARLRLAGHIHRTAPDTWQITHAGQCHLRGAPVRPPRVDEPEPEKSPELTAAIAEHVARRGVTRLPGTGSKELARANKRRGVYASDVWAPKTIQQRRRERLAR